MYERDLHVPCEVYHLLVPAQPQNRELHALLLAKKVCGFFNVPH